MEADPEHLLLPRPCTRRTLTFSPSGPAGPLSPSRPGSPWKGWWGKTRRHDWGVGPPCFYFLPLPGQDTNPWSPGNAVPERLAHTQWVAESVNEQESRVTHSAPRKGVQASKQPAVCRVGCSGGSTRPRVRKSGHGVILDPVSRLAAWTGRQCGLVAEKGFDVRQTSKFPPGFPSTGGLTTSKLLSPPASVFLFCPSCACGRHH